MNRCSSFRNVDVGVLLSLSNVPVFSWLGQVHDTECTCIKAAERNSRDREGSSTLTVPERQAAIQHRSRSVSPHREDQCRARSRPAHVPMQR